MIFINKNIELSDKEVELNPMRAQGAGGQNVNIVIALKNSHTAKENRRITYRYNLFPNLDAFS